jgi:hypothetical protein
MGLDVLAKMKVSVLARNQTPVVLLIACHGTGLGVPYIVV